MKKVQESARREESQNEEVRLRLQAIVSFEEQPKPFSLLRFQREVREDDGQGRGGVVFGDEAGLHFLRKPAAGQGGAEPFLAVAADGGGGLVVMNLQAQIISRSVQKADGFPGQRQISPLAIMPEFEIKNGLPVQPASLDLRGSEFQIVLVVHPHQQSGVLIGIASGDECFGAAGEMLGDFDLHIERAGDFLQDAQRIGSGGIPAARRGRSPEV